MRTPSCPQTASSHSPLLICRHPVPVPPDRARVAVRLQAALEVAYVLDRADRAHLARRLRGLRPVGAGRVEVAEAEAGRGEDDAAEEAAAGVAARAQLQGAFGVLRRGPVLLEVAVAVPELVGELGLVEEAGPAGNLVAGAGRFERPLGPYQ
ncbi:hypothetical protein GA0115246_105972 [Streptomyces sp. SolWspMP-sol7th]|nr:hypothetical protein GA0115246_105972 [Streptomyces sp. SolWspMP-sol7th]